MRSTRWRVPHDATLWRSWASLTVSGRACLASRLPDSWMSANPHTRLLDTTCNAHPVCSGENSGRWFHSHCCPDNVQHLSRWRSDLPSYQAMVKWRTKKQRPLCDSGLHLSFLISMKDCSRIALTHLTKAGCSSGPNDEGFELSAAMVDTGTCVTASSQDASCLRSLVRPKTSSPKMFFIKPDSQGIEMLDHFTLDKKVWLANTFASRSATTIPVGDTGLAGTLSASQSTLGVPPAASSKSSISLTSSGMFLSLLNQRHGNLWGEEETHHCCHLHHTVSPGQGYDQANQVCLCGQHLWLVCPGLLLWHSSPHQHVYPQE